MKNNYEKNGITLRVSVEESKTATLDAIEAYYHFIKADVFIMARSSFSNVAAFYNPNCVIYTRSFYKPLRKWIEINPGNGSDVEEDVKSAMTIIKNGLKKCIIRKKVGKWS